MRTTLTLDDDVVALLKREQARRNKKIKDIVNEALREGLARMSAPKRGSTPYRTSSVSLGRCYLGSLDDIAEILAVSEGEAFR